MGSDMVRCNRRRLIDWPWAPVLTGTIVLGMLVLRYFMTDPLGDQIRIRWTAGTYRTIGPTVVDASYILDGLPIVAGAGFVLGIAARTLAGRERTWLALLIDGLTVALVAGCGLLLTMLVGLNLVIG